jgi:NAD(P)-dependent dehydrogenase (short-subunit alcohol dehydrogenase family)
MKHLVVTGASSGIGRAIAVRLAKDGARVSLLARREDALAETAALTGGSPFSCDLRDATSVDAAFAAAAERNGPIHGLVACAGIGGPNTPGEGDRFAEIVATNVVGTYQSLRAAERHLAPGPDRRDIVVIASVLARFGVPGYTGYCASKTALLGLVRALALELAPANVQVNALCPGWVDTQMARDGIDGMARAMGVPYEQALRRAMSAVPLGRMAKPEEVAGTVAWLFSADATGVTGATIDQNGGSYMP